MEFIKTTNAPAAIGPYSQAVKSGGYLFCSGQIALKSDGVLVKGDVVVQVRQVLDNLKAVLAAAGLVCGKVVKTTIFLRNMKDFPRVNEVYAEYFDGEVKPARATVEVSYLPMGVDVEIDCIAEL